MGEATKNMMPVLFVGHGTPMNAIEKNRFSLKWQEIGLQLPRPETILCISAHWETYGTKVTSIEYPGTIHDFGGFPRELYAQQYPAPGSPELADKICAQITGIEPDQARGLDHGVWSVLTHIYPQANIPVVQLSLDRSRDMEYHYNLGKYLRFLRMEGVMIIGSGNMVHNLWMVRPDERGFNNRFAYDWAERINQKMKEAILNGNHNSLIDYNGLDPDAELAVPSEEHYIPLIYTLGASEQNEQIRIFNDEIVAGSLSMTSLIVGGPENNSKKIRDNI